MRLVVKFESVIDVHEILRGLVLEPVVLGDKVPKPLLPLSKPLNGLVILFEELIVALLFSEGTGRIVARQVVGEIDSADE